MRLPVLRPVRAFDYCGEFEFVYCETVEYEVPQPVFDAFLAGRLSREDIERSAWLIERAEAHRLRMASAEIRTTATEVLERQRQLDLPPRPEVHGRAYQHLRADSILSEVTSQILDLYAGCVEDEEELVEWERR